MQIFLDVAQTDFKTLLVKDISNEADMIAAFSPSGKDSVHGFYLALKHSSQTKYRYLVGKNSLIHFPADILSVNNNSFKEMNNAVSVSGALITQPSGSNLLPEFIDGIYLLEVGYGVDGPAPAAAMLANKKYFATENCVTSYGSFIANSFIETTASGTLTSGDIFEASETSSSVLMISANLQKKYAAAVSRMKSVSSDFQQQSITELLNDFRIAFERTKILVINDSYTEAVNSFEDAESILNHINSIV